MINDDISSEEAEFQQQVEQLKPSISSIFNEPYQAGTENIDIRMRQLLIPKMVNTFQLAHLLLLV